MSEGDDLLQKADALMRRHRAFVAGAAGKDEAVPGDGDVPVLTEVVSGTAAAAAAAPGGSGVDMAELRSALASQLEAWLDEELPQHVMRVLDGITDQLIVQLSLKARSDLLPRLQVAIEAAAQAAKPAPPQD